MSHQSLLQMRHCILETNSSSMLSPDVSVNATNLCIIPCKYFKLTVVESIIYLTDCMAL